MEKRKNLLQSLLISLISTLIFGIVGIICVEQYFQSQSPPKLANTNKSLVRDKELGWDSIPPVNRFAETTGPNIAYIGDSFTHFVPSKDEDKPSKWPEFARKFLKNNNKFTQGETLGVSGYGTLQATLKLKEHIKDLKPEIVVLLFFAWNDIRDNFDTPGIFYNLETRYRPYFVSAESAKIYQPMFLPDFIIGSEIYRRMIIAKQEKITDEQLAKDGINYFTDNKIKTVLSYTHPLTWKPFYNTSQQDSSYVSSAWKATENSLKLLKEITDNSNSKLLVLGIDNALTVDEDVRNEWLPENENIDLELPLKKLGNITKNLSIEYINCLPDLRKLRESLGKKVYNGPAGNLSGHLEPEGDEVVGLLAGKKILEMLNK